MTPHLPTEILSQILSLVNLDEPTVIRQVNRQRFALVCGIWRNSVDRWSDVVVVGIDQLNKLLDEVRADSKAVNRELRVGPRSKALRVEVKLGGGIGPALGGVIDRVPNLERLEIVASVATLKTLGKALATKLGALAKLRAFELRGTVIASEHLPLFVSHWPRLESFALVDCIITDPTNSPSHLFSTCPFTALFKHSAHLEHLRISRTSAPTQVFNGLFARLPSSLSSLSLDCDHSDWQLALTPAPNPPPDRVPDQLQSIAPQLRRFVWPNPTFDLEDEFWMSLTRLRELAVWPACGLDEPGPLAGSADLRQVRILARGAHNLGWHTGPAAKMARLYALDLPQLETLEVPRSYWDAWSAPTRQSVQATAARHSVELVVA